MRAAKRFLVWASSDWRLLIFIPAVLAATFLAAAYASEAFKSLFDGEIELRRAADQAAADAKLREHDEMFPAAAAPGTSPDGLKITAGRVGAKPRISINPLLESE